MPAPPAVIVSTAVDREEVARRLAEALVADRLAACVHVSGPVSSVYRWRGAVERATEWTCAAKTTAASAPAAITRIRALHPYDLPEILVTPVLDGEPTYLAWIAGQVGEDTGVADP